MKKILDHKFIILVSLTILAVVIDLILCLARAYEELFLTILVIGLISIGFSFVCFLKKNIYFNFVALVFGIAIVVLLIVFPAYFCFGGLIIYPISLLLSILFLILK